MLLMNEFIYDSADMVRHPVSISPVEGYPTKLRFVLCSSLGDLGVCHHRPLDPRIQPPFFIVIYLFSAAA